MRIAIDIGGVIIKKEEENGEDTNFDINNVVFLESVFESIAILSLKHDLYLLSFCGKKREDQTRMVLKTTNICQYIPEDKWYFCRKPKLKVSIMIEKDFDLLIDDKIRNCNWVIKADRQALNFGSIEFPNWLSIVDYL